jgi:ribosomal protein S18 acetylase RimI-like enzyme
VYANNLATYTDVSRFIRAGARCDLDQIVAIHKQAFPNTFGSALGKSYLRAFYAWFLADSAALCLVAASEKRLLGYAVGCQNARTYYEQLYGARQKTLVWAALRGLLENPLALVRFRRALPSILPRLAQIMSKRRAKLPQASATDALPAPEIDCASLNVIAVHPSVLGTQVATTLLQAFVKAVYERGVARIQLTVDKSNSRAIRFYEREGWRRFAEAGTNFIYVTHAEA